MNPSPECDRILPLLFADHEDGLSAAERASVRRHVARCAGCRGEWEAERRLTAELAPAGVPARGRFRGWKAAGAVAATVLICVTVFMLGSDERAHGSITSRRLSAALAWTDGDVRPLRTSNHIVIGARDRRTITLDEIGTLDTSGPTVFELDLLDGAWKVVLLRGRISAEIEEGASVTFSSVHGRVRLGAGRHLVTLTSPFLQDEDDAKQKKSAAKLIEEGIAHFFANENEPTKDDLEKSRSCFEEALKRPKISSDERNRALFYLAGAFGRQEQWSEAIKVQEKWLELYPNDDTRDYVLLFLGIYHRRSGNEAEAKKAWETILEESPDSDMAEHARMQLGIAAAPPAEDRPAREAITEAEVPEAVQRGPYLVVLVDLDAKRKADGGFVEAARSAAKFHDAESITFDGKAFARLRGQLRQTNPENVLFVLRPETLDIRLHRRLLLLSAAIDDDPFVDFAFGYLTAGSGEAVKELWKRTARLHRSGLSSRTWIETAVTRGMKSTVIEGRIPERARAAGYRGKELYFAIQESDPECLGFVDDRLPDLESAGVICMTGNGDPQGIWLFDDKRNIDRSRHWKYDPEKVGHDPEGEMPRITSDRFRKLALARPVIWSGTCHSAATHNVFVEGDIVSTFGRTDRPTLHCLPADESLCLSLIDAGAVAFLAPIGANHGMSTSMEIEFALMHGATLGETIKSTWDDVILAAEGDLKLDIPEPGKPDARTEYVMQGGGANRILIGDPALSPFRPTRKGPETITVERDGKSARIHVKRAAGFAPRGWDIYGTDRSADWRIGARVPVKALFGKKAPKRVRGEVEVKDAQGNALPYRLRFVHVESYHGRRYVYVQANAPRKGLDRAAQTAVFTIRRR